MKIKVKKLHPNAVIPKYAKEGDAGLDLTVVSMEINTTEDKVTYDTGLAFEIPKGYVGLVFPRSSIHKKNARLTNSVGVIDSGYRGTVKAVMDHSHDNTHVYLPGERALQLIVIPYPSIELEEAEELSETVRGDSGYGSSGL